MLIKHFNIICKFCFIGIMLIALQGCGPVSMIASTGTTAGLAIAQERSVSDAAGDTAIRFNVADKIFKFNQELYEKTSIKVSEGRVLLTGIIQDPNLRVEASRLAWQVEGVKDVLNEMRIEDGKGISGFTKDSWISTQLRTKLTFDGDVKSINYTIETVGGTIYLLGIAQNQEELDHVIDIAKNIKSVTDVVSYVRLKDEEVRVESQEMPVESEPA